MTELSCLGSAGISAMYLAIPGPSLKGQTLSVSCYSHGRRQNTREVEPNHVSIIGISDRRWHESAHILLSKISHKGKPKVCGVGSASNLLKRMAQVGRKGVTENT